MDDSQDGLRDRDFPPSPLLSASGMSRMQPWNVPLDAAAEDLGRAEGENEASGDGQQAEAGVLEEL